MNPTLFADLVQSLKEARDISQGKMAAARRFEVEPHDVKALREQGGLSQSEFTATSAIVSLVF